MASLKKIAAELNVSYTLVSKVLNNRMGTTGVSEKTRIAILSKAKELDYQPHPLALALKSGKKGAIGVFLHLMGTPGSDITTDFIKSISDSINNNNQRFWLRFFSEDHEFISACDNHIERQIDGLIVGGIEHRGILTKLESLEKNGVPVVSTFCTLHEKNAPTNIAVDYEAQCYLTTRHLIEQGCRQIAHFKRLPQRYRGFVRAHEEADIPINPSLIMTDSSLYIEGGVENTETLLRSGKKFDGIVAESDAQAAGALQTLHQHGIDVPNVVKVTGVDDSPLAKACTIPITSTSNEMAKSGRLAIELLMKKIAGETVEHVMLQPTLHIRQSSS